MTTFRAATRLPFAMAGALLTLALPGAARADTTLADLAKEIAQLKSENRAMRGEIADLREKSRRTTTKVSDVAAQRQAPQPVALPPPSAIPVGATPVFVTADKRMGFGALTITPGGFLAAESVFRSRTTQSDINTDFRSIPFGNNPLVHTNEARLTARQSRLALLAEGQITPTFVASGYVEVDFLGAGQTANSNEANAYQPRIRHLYAALDAESYGLHVLGGQNWSLVTLNSKGITPRNEVIPPTIDGQYIPGFDWTRQAQIRVTKDFDKKLWLSLSAEESQTTFAGGCSTPGAAGGLTPAVANAGIASVNSITCAAAGTGGGFSSLSNYSLNHVPDVVGKAAYEARVADRDVHVEAFGLYRNLYDRVAYTDGVSTSRNTMGYGVGGGLVLPVVPYRLDLQLSGMYGRGIGRYGTSQLADTTFNADGSLKPVREATALGGLTLHATPAIDVYGFGGFEKVFRSYFQNPDGSYVGLGSPALAGADAGCSIEASTVCASSSGNTSAIWQLTGGMWDKVYKGHFGEVRAGVQYSYARREIFNAPGLQTPRTDDHMVLTSMRYFPFQ